MYQQPAPWMILIAKHVSSARRRGKPEIVNVIESKKQTEKIAKRENTKRENR